MKPLFSMQDQEIIEMIRAGKTDKALASLYRSFPAIRKMIRTRGGTYEDTRDIFQETLIILCRKAKEPGFILTARLSTYLYSVCQFLWKDESRKRGHTIDTDANASYEIADQTNLEEIVEQENRARLAEKVLEELGDRCRELLLLFYNSGFRLKEIAAQMGYSSENTAKNQKYKCLEAARKKLKELKQTTSTF